MKRRGMIEEAVRRAVNGGEPENYVIVYVERSPNGRQGLAEVRASEIIGVSRWAMTLKDEETVIPLHRVVEVRSLDGSYVWRRYSKA
ncbi:MAG: DUF504 domain-containing protein [Acidilobus sp.]